MSQYEPNLNALSETSSPLEMTSGTAKSPHRTEAAVGDGGLPAEATSPITREKLLTGRRLLMGAGVFAAAFVAGTALLSGPADDLSVMIALEEARAGQTTEALQRLTQRLKTAPDDVAALTARAELAIDLREDQTAIHDLTRLIALQPREPLWQQKRAEILQLSGKADLALRDYNSVIQQQPQAGSALYNRAALHGQNGDLTQARADLARSLTVE